MTLRFFKRLVRSRKPDRICDIASELYQQLNYIADIAASSQAVADHLRPITDDILDESFARVDSELISTARQVAQGCNDSLDACQQTRQILMQSIQAFQTINQTLVDLCQSSDNIQHVADMINSFARRTRLVAINARIEAAQAGEAGKGFEVVAQEVHKLAKQIGNESASIQEAVGQITGHSRQAQQLVESEIEHNHTQEQSVNRMIQTNQQLAQSGKQLPQLVDKLDRFLEPLEMARQADQHNQMISVTTSNVHRNLTAIHNAVRQLTADTSTTQHIIDGIESFIDALSQAMIQGIEQDVRPLVKQLLKTGVSPTVALDAVGKAVITANMHQKRKHMSVGDYYFNFMIVDQAMKVIEPLLPRKQSVKKMTVVLGNPLGDHHSLGRNMVGLFLKSAGIQVIDVGGGADVRKFVEAAKTHQAKVIGISSLLIESAKQITPLRQMLNQYGMQQVKIVGGGACFTIDPDLARQVGADFAAQAASDMVSLVHEVYGHRPLEGRNAA
ncbi:MAG: methyl-accepting chemotaxis protein [Phycisphaeraceae bacterium JB051]